MTALILWAGVLRLDLFTPFAQLYAFRVQAMGLLLVGGAAVLALSRRRLWGLAIVLLALSPLPQVLPRVLAQEAAGVPMLRVLAVNVEANGADLDQVVALALQRQADVVVLPESSQAYAEEVVRLAAASGLDLISGTDNPLVAAGSDYESPRQRSDGPYPTSLLVRRDLRPAFDLQRPSGALGSLTADIVRDGEPFAIAAVHPAPPIPGLESDWRIGHRFLSDLCASEMPTLLVGDYNSTLDHSVMRDLLAAGCRDAAEITGNGLTGTWPSSAPAPLRIPIDHLLLTPAAGTVLGFEVIEVTGTDHLATFTVLGRP
ncbi:MAG: endonuclease/exonuclease/phosphatase family protein [Pseudonocardia sp.]